MAEKTPTWNVYRWGEWYRAMTAEDHASLIESQRVGHELVAEGYATEEEATVAIPGLKGKAGEGA